EEIANNAVRQNLDVSTRIMPLDEARELGAMALFGEKYGETVRVVEIGGPWSLELCAGTHVTRSAEIGLINVISETSVGSSNRRIESLVGLEAFRDLATERAIVSELTSTLKTPRDQVPARISELLANLKAAEKRIAEFESAALIERVPALLAQAGRVGSVTALVTHVGALQSSDDLRTLVTTVRGRLGSDPLVVALAADVAGKPAVIVATNEAARQLHAKAGALAKTAAGILGGGGGGKDDLAQGGGSNLEAIPAALEAISAALPR
ncbi:MAG: alanyl-tRNA synthetase, partial [Microbacteriaceae bacterium]|nr:alanyl-tRNA synthetase [Microbacteriaceae bacterium]